MRDANLQAEQAVEENNSVAIATGREEWYSQASEFWAAQAGRSELDGKKDGPKRYRSKAKAWVTACDHMLVTMTGAGLRHFAQPEEGHRGDPERWPVLTICLDQGSDGWAGGMWLQHQAKVNCLLLFDVSHRGWNDACLALRSCGILLLQICMNLDHGPWQDGKWHKELREATSLYQSLATPHSCPMFAGLLGQILHDRGEDERIAEDGIADEVFSTLGDTISSMSIKASMCRWFGLVESGENYSRAWHTRLLIHIFLLQQLGILTNSLMTRVGLSLSASKDIQAGDLAKGTTARDVESVRQLGAKCRNSLELVTMVLLDPMMYQSLTIILAVLRPLRAFHSEQSKRLRSTKEALEWYIEQSLGKGFDILRQLAEMTSDHGVLFVAGIGKDSVDANAKNRSCSEDPKVLREDKLADMFAGLIVALISRRLQVSFWYTHGLPGSFPKLLDLVEGARFLVHLKSCYEDYLAMKSLNYPFWKKLTARSPFNLILVQQIVEIAKGSGWTITEGLLHVVRQAWSTMGASKIIEDAWQRERFQEERDSVNRRVQLGKVWMNLVIKKVLPEVHRFEEIPYEHQPIGRGLKDLNIQALFHPKVKDATVGVRSIEGKSATAGWHSLSPTNYFGHVADLGLFRFCASNDKLHLGDKSWLAILLGCPNLIVKKRGSRAYLAFASYSGIAGWGWPLVAEECRKRTIYRLDSTATPEDIAMLYIVDLEEWQATTFDWAGKLRMKVEFGWEHAPLTIVPRYSFEGLLQAVARQCFFSLPKTPLLQLAKYLQLEVDAGMNDVQILERLIMHSLPKLKPNDLVEILRQRTASAEPGQEYLNILGRTSWPRPSMNRTCRRCGSSMRPPTLP